MCFPRNTRWREFTPGSDRVFTGLPNGRRGTAHVVTESADGRVRGESVLEPSPHGPLPGVAITVIHGAVGDSKSYTSVPARGGAVVNSYNEDDPELMQPGALYNLCSMTMRWGAPEDTLALGMTAEPERSDAGDASGDPLSFANFVPGVCACVGNNPSQQMRVASAETTVGGLHDWEGRYFNPGMGLDLGGIVKAQNNDANKEDPYLAYDKQLAKLLGMRLTDEFLEAERTERERKLKEFMIDKHGGDPAAIRGRWASGTQTWANHLALKDLELSDCTLIKWTLVFEAGGEDDEYIQYIHGTLKNRLENTGAHYDAGGTDVRDQKASLREILLAGLQYSFLNRLDHRTSPAHRKEDEENVKAAADALKMAEMLASHPNPDDNAWEKYFPDAQKRNDYRRRWRNVTRAVGAGCENSKNPDGANSYRVVAQGSPKQEGEVKRIGNTVFVREGKSVRVPDHRPDRRDD